MKTTLMMMSLLVLAAEPASAAPLEFETPKGWEVEKPKSRMRSHQYKAPRAEGDTRDAKLILYYFGKAGGGTLQANIDRWKTQVTRAKGDPEPKKSEATHGGLRVVLFDITGTYTAPVFRPGAPKATPQPGTRVINGVIYSGEGKYYVKLIGPKATVAKHDKAFQALLASLVAKGAARIAKPTSQPTSQPTSKPTSQPAKDPVKKPTSQPARKSF